MDIIISQPILLVACLIALIAFIVYSVTTIRRLGIVTYHKRIFQAGKAVIIAVGKLITSLAGVLAASAKTAGSTEATANAARGGVLNHRTGKFDDGTDPAGWYEQD